MDKMALNMIKSPHFIADRSEEKNEETIREEEHCPDYFITPLQATKKRLK